MTATKKPSEIIPLCVDCGTNPPRTLRAERCTACYKAKIKADSKTYRESRRAS